jgi:uncharacterized membrane protein YtjA (UPF0391 family)
MLSARLRNKRHSTARWVQLTDDSLREWPPKRARKTPLRARFSGPSTQGAKAMLHYAIVFLVIALIAAVLGFGGIAGAAAGIAKILFLVFLVLFIVSLFMGRRGSPPV